jgi:hypothetical protein
MEINRTVARCATLLLNYSCGQLHRPPSVVIRRSLGLDPDPPDPEPHLSPAGEDRSSSSAPLPFGEIPSDTAPLGSLPPAVPFPAKCAVPECLSLRGQSTEPIQAATRRGMGSLNLPLRRQFFRIFGIRLDSRGFGFLLRSYFCNSGPATPTSKTTPTLGTGRGTPCPSARS